MYLYVWHTKFIDCDKNWWTHPSVRQIRELLLVSENKLCLWHRNHKITKINLCEYLTLTHIYCKNYYPGTTCHRVPNRKCNIEQIIDPTCFSLPKCHNCQCISLKTLWSLYIIKLNCFLAFSKLVISVFTREGTSYYRACEDFFVLILILIGHLWCVTRQKNGKQRIDCCDIMKRMNSDHIYLEPLSNWILSIKCCHPMPKTHTVRQET